MIFSSNIFLYAFLPISLIAYYFVRFGLKRMLYANLVLLVLSILLYAWENGPAVLLLMASMVVNYILSLVIERATNAKK